MIPQIGKTPAEPIKPNTVKSVFEDLTKDFREKNVEDDKKMKTIPPIPMDIPKSLLKDDSKTIEIEQIPKLKRLRNSDDYDECYPELSLPTLEELKKHRSRFNFLLL